MKNYRILHLNIFIDRKHDYRDSSICTALQLDFMVT